MTPLDLIYGGISRKDFIKSQPNDPDAGAFYDAVKKASNAGKSKVPDDRRYSDVAKNFTSGDSTTDFFANKAGVLGKTMGALSDATRAIASSGQKIFDSQLGKDDPNTSAMKVFDVIKNGGLNPLKLLGGSISLIFDEILNQLKSESQLLTEINSKVGISGELSKGLQDDMIEASIEASRYGVTLGEIGQLYTGMSEQSGKFALINKKFIDSAIPVSTVLGKSMSEMASTVSVFENVGIGASSTMKTLDASVTRTVGLGLNARKITSDMETNIGRLNQFGFTNGIRGLERMVQKANEFRMSMDEVFKIADTVMDPDKAISLSANLAVLGGAMGSFGDPLRMMYDATNNVEGLQDALIEAAGSLSTYNAEQGRFEITGVNLRRAKAMADELGISYTELTKGAIAAAERTSATAALMGRPFSIDDKEKEFLINMSRMEGGEMKITVPESLMSKFGNEQEIALDKLTAPQKDALVEYQKTFEKMDSKQLAMSQLTETQQMARGIDVIAAYYRVRGTQIIKGASKSLFNEDYKNLSASIKKYSDEVSADKSYTVEKDTYNDVNNLKTKVSEAVTKPMETIKVGYDYLKGKVTGSNETQPMTKQDFEEITMKVHNATKNEKNGTIVINNELQPVDPNDYRYVKIK
jgi:hypothetical protein